MPVPASGDVTTRAHCDAYTQQLAGHVLPTLPYCEPWHDQKDHRGRREGARTQDHLSTFVLTKPGHLSSGD